MDGRGKVAKAMARFRKKPVVVEAQQFFPDRILPFHDKGACCFDGERWYVTTIHGQRTFIVARDWIILEPDGKHFYPCKPDIFEATYEPA